MKSNEGDLRVWWIRNPPSYPTYYRVDSPLSGKDKLAQLAMRDLTLAHIFANCGGLEIYLDGWEEWLSEVGESIDGWEQPPPPLPAYFIDGYGGWFVVRCENLKTARHVAREEYAHIKCVRPATDEEVRSYARQHGVEAETVEY